MRFQRPFQNHSTTNEDSRMPASSIIPWPVAFRPADKKKSPPTPKDGRLPSPRSAPALEGSRVGQRSDHSAMVEVCGTPASAVFPSRVLCSGVTRFSAQPQAMCLIGRAQSPQLCLIRKVLPVPWEADKVEDSELFRSWSHGE